MKPIKYLYIISALLFLAAAFWAGWSWQEHLYRARLREGPSSTPGVVIDPDGAARKKIDLLVDEHRHITAQGQAELPIHRGSIGRLPGPAGEGLAVSPAPVVSGPTVTQPVATPGPRLQQPAGLYPAGVQPTPTPTATPVATPRALQINSPPRETGNNPKLRDDWPPLAELVPVGPRDRTEFRGLMPGDSVKAPLVGTIKTEVVNERTGEIMAAKTQPITGTALVTAGMDQLKVETEFDDTMRIGVTPPAPAVKRVHLGAALKLEERQTPALGGYLQYDIPLSQGKTFDWSVPLRVERWPDGWRGSIAVEVRF